MPKKFISNQVLIELLDQATEDEILSLTRLIEPNQKNPYSATKLQEEICEMGGHGIVNIFRGQGTGYLDIVDEVADELKIKGLLSYNLRVKYFEEIENLKFDEKIAKQKGIEYAQKAEEKIIIKLLELVYDKLDPNKKEEFDKQINKVAKQFDSSLTANLSGTAGLMALGNLGGFATYTFLTTSLNTISMGTLGFGAYTAATSFLSIALGPAGWAALGVAGVFALGKPEYEKLIPIVAMVGAIRQRITYDRNSKKIEVKEQPKIKIDIFNDIKDRKFEQAKSLIDESDFNVNSKDSDENTPLIYTYKKALETKKNITAYLDIVTKLIKNGADVNLVNKDEDNPLLLALKLPYDEAYNDVNLEIIKILVKKSDNLNYKDNNENTALLLALNSFNNEKLVDIIKTLIKKCNDLDHKNKDNQTALMLAVTNKYTEIVKILLSKKVKLNICTKDKYKKKVRTALMLACEQDNVEAEVITLLSKEISTINDKNDYNQTAFHIAILKGNLNSIKILIENKADINIESQDGFTPFMLACYKGDMQIIQYLYEYIDDINLKNQNDFTALTWACFGGEFNNWKLDVVEFLVKNGAKVDTKDKDYFTPLMWASIRGNTKVVEFLISKEVGIDAQNIDGYSSLIWASIRGHHNIVKLLLTKKSTNTELKSNTEKSALDFANEKGHQSIIELFEPSETKIAKKNTNSIDTFSFNNFKAFGDHPQRFSKKPITLIYGPNSVGKSTVVNAFSYLKSLQIDDDIDGRKLTSIFGDVIDIDGIEQFIHKRDKNNIIKLEISLKDLDKEIASFFEDDDINIRIAYIIDIQNLVMSKKYFNHDMLLATKEILYNRNNNEYKKRDLNIVFEDNKFKNLIELVDRTQKNNKFQYIGPIRPNPTRDADHSFEETEEQYNSESLWALLTHDSKVLNSVNKKLKKLDMKYVIVNHKFYDLQDDFDSLQNANDKFTKYFKDSGGYRKRLEYIPKENQSNEFQSPIEKKERLVFKDLKKDEVEVSNRDLGSGMSQVLPILSATTAHQNTTIAIEQPELHLHPKLQMELADEFIRSSKENKNEFMIETHSEHILLRIMRWMRYTDNEMITKDNSTFTITPDDICLLYIDQDNQENVFIKELELSSDGVLLDSWPKGFFDEKYNEVFK